MIAARAPRLAVLSVSAGDGHVRCAEAVRLAAEALGVRAWHLDLMDLVPSWFRRLYVDAYLAMVRRCPAAWAALYHATDGGRGRGFSALRLRLEDLQAPRLARWLAATSPHTVVCTHFLPARLMARLGAPIPTWVALTDYDVHEAWIHRGLAGYCASADETAWRLRGRVDGEVTVTGIPIMPAFACAPPVEECRRELGLDPRRRTVVALSGGLGMGPVDLLSARLIEACPQAQVVALAGRNQALLARLRALAARVPGRLVALPFTDRIERVLACADVAVGKPGGLSTAECLALRVPLVAVGPLPGQEERNAEHVLEQGAGLRAHDIQGAVERVRRLLDDAVRRARMRACAARAARPHAARAVVETALGCAAQPIEPRSRTTAMVAKIQ